MITFTVAVIASIFEGSIESYFLAGCIGFLVCPLSVFLIYCFCLLIDKIRDHMDYCKKRRKVVEKLYPQYEELMKGEEND